MRLHTDYFNHQNDSKLLTDKIAKEQKVMTRQLLTQAMEVLDIDKHERLIVKVDIINDTATVDYKETRRVEKNQRGMGLDFSSAFMYELPYGISARCMPIHVEQEYVLTYEQGEISIKNKTRLKKKEYNELHKQAETIFKVLD